MVGVAFIRPVLSLPVIPIPPSACPVKSYFTGVIPMKMGIHLSVIASLLQ